MPLPPSAQSVKPDQLLPELGGSFGIAFATTIAERRSNFHQSRLGEHLPASSPRLQETVSILTHYLEQHGWLAADAARGASATVARMFDGQVRILAYMDCFYLIGVLMLLLAPLALLTRNFRVDGDAAAGH